MLLLGTDYEFIEPKGEDKREVIKLLTGEYAGVTFRYGGIRFEEKDGEMHLLFNYDVLHSPSIKYKSLLKNTEFKNYIGDLLVQQLSEKFETDIIDEAGTDYTEESDL